MDAIIPSLQEVNNSGNSVWYVTLFSLLGGGGTVNVTANILFTGTFSIVA
jgi:hypothetical protein